MHLYESGRRRAVTPLEDDRDHGVLKVEHDALDDVGPSLDDHIAFEQSGQVVEGDEIGDPPVGRAEAERPLERSRDEDGRKHVSIRQVVTDACLH